MFYFNLSNGSYNNFKKFDSFYIIAKIRYNLIFM